MKTILLLRHSEPQKRPGISNAEIPLSDDGSYYAEQLFQNVIFRDAKYVYSSPYKRAYDTARVLSPDVTTDDRLAERALGDESLLTEAFWGRQYLDHDFRNKDGESLNDVRARMNSFFHDLLNCLEDGERAVVVSHAAAICAYLLNFCTITVLNSKQKSRKIQRNDNIILCGKIRTPSAFVLHFQAQELSDISYIE